MFYVFHDVALTGGLIARPRNRRPRIIHGEYATEIHVPVRSISHRGPRKKAVLQGVKEGVKRAVMPKEYEGYGIQPILAKDIYEGLLPQIAQAWAKGRRDVGITVCFKHMTPGIKAGVLELASQYHYVKTCCPQEREMAQLLYETYGMGLTGIPKDVPTVAIMCQTDGKIPQAQEIIWLEKPQSSVANMHNFTVGTLKTTANTSRFGLSVPVNEAVIAALYMENNIKNKEITLDIEQMSQYNIVI